MDNNNNGTSNSGNDEQTITIVIILIAAIVIFFLVVAWCGFFYGLWRNKKVALDISRMEQHRRQQQYRRQQLLQHQQQQHNAPPQLLQQQQRYTPQQQQQLQQQLKKQQLRQQQLRQQQLRQQEHNANRSRPSSQLSPNPSHNNFTHQPQLNSYPQMPYHGERISVHSRYITPAAVAIPVFIPPRDYADDDNHDQTPLSAVAANSSVSSSGLDHSYHNRTFDYFEGPSSPNQSFTNIGYQSTVSYPDGMVGINQSNLRSGYSPASPRSTSTPLVPKMQAKHKRTSQPENYTSMEMQQYQQLQYWPQNY